MIISDKKYACETCIKGHRSSSCKHFDRPLFEIKKKGRPVTQCEHCRELRKTKQVHVKCICEGRVELPTIGKGSKPGFDSAAFPNGVSPHALETSVAPEGFSSDSDLSSGNNITCNCKDSAICPCTVAHRRAASASEARKTTARSEADLSIFGDSSRVQSNTAQILARIAELRPVLPRPIELPPHSPSYAGQLASARYHENTLYSPYERAYEMSHQQALHPHSSPQAHFNGQPLSSPTHDEASFPSACACGDGCQCPGCTYHNNTIISAESAFSTCANPGHCLTCLDCTILSLQNDGPGGLDTALSIPQSNGGQSSEPVDEWLRQLASNDGSYGEFTTAGPSSSPPSSMWVQHPDLGASDYNVVPMEFDLNNAIYGQGYGGGGGMDYTRSRSVSTSSQSSHQDSLMQRDRSMSGTHQVPYRPTGRVQGPFENVMGSRSSPQVNLGVFRNGVGPSSRSPVSYANSSPDVPMSPVYDGLRMR